eukprot:5860552-Pyramimonas_sp.AAC.1
MWSLSFKEKKEIYSSRRCEVGGQTPGITDDNKPAKVLDDDIQPVTWHGQPKSLYAELGHAPKAKAFVNLTSIDDVLAEHCIENNIPYVGFVFNECHRKALETRLAQRTFALMQDENSPLYQPKLCTLLGKRP